MGPGWHARAWRGAGGIQTASCCWSAWKPSPSTSSISSRGTRLLGGTQPTGLPRLDNAPRIQIQTISLNTLAAHLGPIDLLHVDIQGAEVPVLRAAGSLLRDRVRRLLIGTHGRDVEGQAIDLLIPLGFQLQAEDACRYRLDGARPILVVDGTQIWINRTLVAG
jgi:Methyltransferase FkbM domain